MIDHIRKHGKLISNDYKKRGGKSGQSAPESINQSESFLAVEKVPFDSSTRTSTSFTNINTPENTDFLSSQNTLDLLLETHPRTSGIVSNSISQTSSSVSIQRTPKNNPTGTMIIKIDLPKKDKE